MANNLQMAINVWHLYWQGFMPRQIAEICGLTSKEVADILNGERFPNAQEEARACFGKSSWDVVC